MAQQTKKSSDTIAEQTGEVNDTAEQIGPVTE